MENNQDFRFLGFVSWDIESAPPIADLSAMINGNENLDNLPTLLQHKIEPRQIAGDLFGYAVPNPTVFAAIVQNMRLGDCGEGVDPPQTEFEETNAQTVDPLRWTCLGFTVLDYWLGHPQWQNDDQYVSTKNSLGLIDKFVIAHRVREHMDIGRPLDAPHFVLAVFIRQ